MNKKLNIEMKQKNIEVAVQTGKGDLWDLFQKWRDLQRQKEKLERPIVTMRNTPGNA